MMNPSEMNTQTDDLNQNTDTVTENIADTNTETTTASETPTNEAPDTNEVQKIQSELAELKDKYLRLYSDFDNFRKRTAKERLDLISSASERVLVSLLPVLDDVERAEGTFEKHEDGRIEKEGIQLIFNKFKHILKQNGLQEMEAKGKAFDVDLHECITQFPAPSEDLKDKVIDVAEKGYYLNEKVIRFAKVVVGN
jgi:molecular chaperone GrpE